MRYLIVSTLVVIQLTLLPVVAGVIRHQGAAMLEKRSAAAPHDGRLQSLAGFGLRQETIHPSSFLEHMATCLRPLGWHFCRGPRRLSQP